MHPFKSDNSSGLHENIVPLLQPTWLCPSDKLTFLGVWCRFVDWLVNRRNSLCRTRPHSWSSPTWGRDAWAGGVRWRPAAARPPSVPALAESARTLQYQTTVLWRHHTTVAANIFIMSILESRGISDNNRASNHSLRLNEDALKFSSEHSSTAATHGHFYLLLFCFSGAFYWCDMCTWLWDMQYSF